MAYASVNGIKVYYREYGEGLPMVLVHGNGSNHVTWAYQTTFFSRWYRVITPDVRGFGNTVDVPEGPSTGAGIEDLLGLLDHLKLERAIIVGHSMGGRITLPFAFENPGRTMALVMVDAVGGIDWPGEFNDRFAAVRQRADTLPSVQRFLSPKFIAREPALTQLHMGIAGLNVGNPRRRGGLPPVRRFGPEALQALAGTPTLYVSGGDDALNPPDIIRSVQQATPNAELAYLPDSGHSPYWEQPDAFNQVLLAFLERHGLDPHAPEGPHLHPPVL